MNPAATMILSGALASGLGGLLGNIGGGGLQSYAMDMLRGISRQQNDLMRQNLGAVRSVLPTLAPDYASGQRSAAVSRMIARPPSEPMPEAPQRSNAASVASASAMSAKQAAKAAAAADRREQMLLPADQQREAALAAQRANERLMLNNSYAQALQAIAQNASQAAAAGGGGGMLGDFAGLLSAVGPLLSLYGATMPAQSPARPAVRLDAAGRILGGV